MKRNLCLALALLLVGAVQVKAQQIAVVTDKGTTEFSKWPYELAKITFSNGQALFHYDNQVVNVFDIKDINKIVFYTTSDVAVTPDTEPIAYSSLTEELVVNAVPGTAIDIYRACGKCVWSGVQTIAAPAISVRHLPAGVYIVAVGSETLKFVKR